MKVIAENLITSISVDSENSNFPIENLLDEHPKRVWKSDSDYQATITCEVSAGVSGLGLFGTNAIGAVVTVSDPNAVQWSDSGNIAWETGVAWDETEPTITLKDIEQQGDNYALWAEFGQVESTVDVEILLTTLTNQTLEAGVLRIGEALEFSNPHYGMQEGMVDYSVEAQLASGSFYYGKRDIVRTFSGVLIEERDRDFYDFLYTVGRENGRVPLAWRITDKDNFDWVVFGRFDQLPFGTHDYPSHSTINFQIIEVL